MKTLRYFLKLLLVSTAYYSISRLSLLLAIPPGFASPIWPAAGIAVVAILFWGYRIWPAIFLGSFFVNLSPGLITNTSTLTHLCLLSFGIGTGATVQALLSAYLVNKYTPKPHHLEEAKHIGKLMLLVGPIGCIVSASIGIGTLYLMKILPLSGITVNWFVWWVGDSIGAIGFVPILIILFSTTVQYHRKILVSIPIVGLLGIIIVLFLQIRQLQHAKSLNRFDQLANKQYQLLEKALDSHEELLNATKSFLLVNKTIDRDQFQQFVQKTYQYHSEIQAIEWIPRVTNSERHHYETQAQRDGYPDFQITELQNGQLVRAKQRDEYYPVYYVEPYAGNEAALGYDLASDPARQHALIRAQHLDQPITTAPITLVRDATKQTGILIFHPVYMPSDRSQIKGFVLGVYRIDRLANKLFINDPQHLIALQITDTIAPGDNKILYDNSDPLYTPPFLLKKTIIVGKRQWQLLFTPTQDYINLSRDWGSWFVLIGGLGFVVLIEFILLLITGQVSAVQRLVNDQTTDIKRYAKELSNQKFQLESTNANLEHFAYVATHDLRSPVVNLSGLLDHIDTTQLNTANKELITHIQTTTAILSQTLHSLLDVIGARKTFSEKRVTIKFEKILDHVQHSLQNEIKQSNTKIHTNFSQCPKIPYPKGHLYSILLNLISNAIKYKHPSRDPVIKISCRSEKNIAIVSVEDNGQGIDIDKFGDRIFMIFKRIDENTEGKGIGLYLVKSQVEALGGRIEVESELGKGSTFTVYLNQNPVSTRPPQLDQLLQSSDQSRHKTTST